MLQAVQLDWGKQTAIYSQHGTNLPARIGNLAARLANYTTHVSS